VERPPERGVVGERSEPHRGWHPVRVAAGFRVKPADQHEAVDVLGETGQEQREWLLRVDRVALAPVGEVAVDRDSQEERC
jgi:hypothetical protein